MTDEVVRAKVLEKSAICMAEDGDVNKAIEALTEAIALAPHLPSLYNNRAQAYRLNNDLVSKFMNFCHETDKNKRQLFLLT